MKNRVIAIFLAGMMTLSLASCGSAGTTTANDSSAADSEVLAESGSEGAPR